jgi:hypothetical protein
MTHPPTNKFISSGELGNNYEHRNRLKNTKTENRIHTTMLLIENLKSTHALFNCDCVVSNSLCVDEANWNLNVQRIFRSAETAYKSKIIQNIILRLNQQMLTRLKKAARRVDAITGNIKLFAWAGSWIKLFGQKKTEGDFGNVKGKWHHRRHLLLCFSLNVEGLKHC